IGLQSHFRSPTPPETVWKLLDRFAKFNLPMSITEFDFPGDDEELQARYTRDFMTAVFAHPGVDGFVMWGFWEGRHWRPDCAMFRRDWSIKPNGQAYKDLVFKQWWTDADGQTAADGAYKVRGFLGDYEVTVSSYSLRKTEAAKLDKPGSTLTVKFGGT
ncbi:MAG TPA: endo-1,4-beta-xylanase, partial [Phycisphaerae bacterium]|nr:endo-1,4-beta-xylanase [Phycisphaerae bacterium]